MSLPIWENSALAHSDNRGQVVRSALQDAASIAGLLINWPLTFSGVGFEDNSLCRT